VTVETRRDEIGRAVFGVADGATSLVGVLAGLIVAHAAPTTILTTAGGLAVASAVGMASGDYLGGATRRLAAVMGLATLAGSLLPAISVALIPGAVGLLIGALCIVAFGIAIAEVRAQERGRPRAYLLTAAVLIVASALSAGAAVGLGAVG